jgi:hypothetical protein
MYFVSSYIVDVFYHLWAMVCIILLPDFFGLHFFGMYIPGLLWVFANPLFLYVFTYIFIRDSRMSPSVVYGGFSLFFTFAFLVADLGTSFWTKT